MDEVYQQTVAAIHPLDLLNSDLYSFTMKVFDVGSFQTLFHGELKV
jgi:hypothetical protein